METFAGLERMTHRRHDGKDYLVITVTVNGEEQHYLLERWYPLAEREITCFWCGGTGDEDHGHPCSRGDCHVCSGSGRVRTMQHE